MSNKPKVITTGFKGIRTRVDAFAEIDEKKNESESEPCPASDCFSCFFSQGREIGRKFADGTLDHCRAYSPMVHKAYYEGQRCIDYLERETEKQNQKENATPKKPAPKKKKTKQ